MSSAASVRPPRLQTILDLTFYVDLYPLSDLLYRTVALTDDRVGLGSGANPFYPHLVEAYDTDAYGRTRVYSDPGPDGHWFSDDDTPLAAAVEPVCRYLFTGREYDAETGLYYYRARYYHPDLGRFTGRDPLLYGGGDMNLYAYGQDNPLVNIDPSGEFFFLIPLLIGGIGLAIGAIIGNIAYQSTAGPPVAAPSLGTSLIPVVGSSQAAINDFQHRRWIWGSINTAFAISDIFLVNSIVGGLGKLAVEGGSRLLGHALAEESVRTAESAGLRELVHYTTPAAKTAIKEGGKTAGKLGSKWGVYATERVTQSRILQSLYSLQVPWRVGEGVSIIGRALRHFRHVPAIGMFGGYLRYGARAWYTPLGSLLLKEGTFEAGEILTREAGQLVFRSATVAEARRAAAHAFTINYGFDLALHAAARLRAATQRYVYDED